MAGPYQRLSNGQSADSGAQAITTVVNAVEAGLEDAEATITAQAALIAGKAATAHTHTGTYDPAGSAATAQAAAVQRANHTGTQAASTISDFNTAVRTNRLDQMAAPTTAVGMGSQRITNVASPSASTDAANKAYVDSLSGPSANPLSYLYPESYGAVLDGRQIVVTTSAGNPNIVATASGHEEGAAIFAASDVGKTIHLDKVGTGGTYHKTTVASYTSPTQVALTVAPVIGASNVYGVVGTDNTTAIHNASQDAALGGVVYFKPADRFYFVPTAGVITLPRGCRWQGAGKRSSKIITTATTGRLITWSGMDTSCDGLTITHLYGAAGGYSGDTASVPPTSGCGIYVDSQYWGNNSLTNCVVSGFYDNVVVNQGEVFNICENYLGGARRYNLSLASATHMDAGQANVWNNTFNGWAPTGITRTVCDIFWVSGGGLNVQNNTFGQAQANIQMDMTLNGTEPYVSNIIISGNTIEDFSTDRGAIWIHAPGNGDFSYVSITNNVIATVNSGGAVNPPIQVVADAGSHPRYGAYGFYLVSIVGNVARVGSQKIALLDRVTDYTVVGNLSSNQGNTFTATNSTGGV